MAWKATLGLAHFQRYRCLGTMTQEASTYYNSVRTASSRRWDFAIASSRRHLDSSQQQQQQQQLNLPKKSVGVVRPMSFLVQPHDEEPDDDNLSNSEQDSPATTDHTQGRDRHCSTCSCSDTSQASEDHVLETPVAVFPTNACGRSKQDNLEALPPPLPEPTYSVHKRVLPSHLEALSSFQGRKWLMECLKDHTAESYWALMEQFTNQSDPAFCGVTTLLVVLNAMGVDPLVRWRGGWRFYGNEDVLLDRCCIPMERVRRAGITLEEFGLLGKCQGLRIALRRPTNATDGTEQNRLEDLDTFRRDVRRTLRSRENEDGGMLVVSFSRSALGQTGEGHFSPIGAYHEQSDRLLVLDVARFKYAPYWVTVEALYDSMLPIDEATKKPRGWFVLQPPEPSLGYQGPRKTSEDRRPAHLVPLVGEADICPIGKIKVDYCAGSQTRNRVSSQSADGDPERDL